MGLTALAALNIEKVLEKIKELPTLPDVVFRVNEVVNNPKTSAVDLEEVISRDQAIAAKVLKMVNSAFYGLPGRVDTLARAIPLLGFSTVRNIVMSVSIFDTGPIENFDMKQFWRHSFGTSVVARAIAVSEGLPDADSQSLAGLLHDMGKVLLFQYYSKEYEKVASLMERKKTTFIRAERELYLIDHAEVGGALATRWGFPPNITSSIAYHHNPEPAGDLIDFVSVTATANVLSQIGSQNGIFAIHGGYESMSEACRSFHPLRESTFDAVVAELSKQMQFFDNFIDRMELFRRPSPLIEMENQKARNKASIWTLPER
jgi:putative nucleotidyltransferase with HDIG domain